MTDLVAHLIQILTDDHDFDSYNGENGAKVGKNGEK